MVTGSEATQASSAGEGIQPGARGTLLRVLDRILALTDGLLGAGPRRNLAEAHGRLAQDRFNLVVLGEFKRGKSTLINALLDRDLLPTGVVPLTSVVTSIEAGTPDRLVIRHDDGREVERPVDELADYVTEVRNPANRLGVELARLQLDHPLLRAGLELVDTPGIGSIHSHNTSVARDFLPRVDAALCVLDAGQPLSESERDLFVDASRRVPRLLMIVNKIDHLDPSDRDVAVEFVRSAVADVLGRAGTELYAVSARRREGLEPLRERLLELASQERESLLVRSVAGVARGVAADGAQAARFEARAIQLPLDELQARARDFETRIAELQAAGEDAGDLLEQGTHRALERLVNQPLQDHARHEEPRLRAAVDEYIAQLGPIAPRQLSEELASWIDASVRASFSELAARYEVAIAEELSQLERRYAARVSEILEQVQGVAQDVFGERAADVLPQTGLQEPSRFTFKLHDVENALDMIVGFGRTMAPGALGRRMVVRDAEQRLIDMTDRHAGRLRSELAQRVLDAAYTYRRELAGAVTDAVRVIRDAVERAAQDHRRGEEHAAARRQELADIERECARLATEMDRWLWDQPPHDETEPR